MKVFKAIVKKDVHNVAIHYVTVDDEASDRVKFHFSRIGFNIKGDGKRPVKKMVPATFKQQIRTYNRAYAVTDCNEEDYVEFIKIMMKEAYEDGWEIRVEAMDSDI